MPQLEYYGQRLALDFTNKKLFLASDWVPFRGWLNQVAPVDLNSRCLAWLAVSVGFAQACGAQVGDNIAASGGSQNIGAKSADAATAVDGSPAQDAAYCEREVACRNSCCGCNSNEANTSDIVDCAVQLKTSPIDPSGLGVYIGCNLAVGPVYERDAGFVPNPDSWIIDYSREPASLVFGTTLCERLFVTPNLPIYVIPACNCIN